MGQEAEALDAQSDGGADEFYEEMVSDFMFDERVAALERLKRLMRDAKRAETGATIRCAQCEKLIVKSNYQKVFCSNARTHGKRNCKDRYHNRVSGLRLYLELRSD